MVEMLAVIALADLLGDALMIAVALVSFAAMAILIDLLERV